MSVGYFWGIFFFQAEVGIRCRDVTGVQTCALPILLVDEGKMSLDDPLEIDWLPELSSPETDPRNSITLRHLLNMSSGLKSPDNNGLEYATGSG